MDDIPQRVATVEEVVLVKVMGGPVGPAGHDGRDGRDGIDGKDGESVEVFGPQTVAPIPHRRGDIWIYQTGAMHLAGNRSASIPEVTYLPGAGPDHS